MINPIEFYPTPGAALLGNAVCENVLPAAAAGIDSGTLGFLALSGSFLAATALRSAYNWYYREEQAEEGANANQPEGANDVGAPNPAGDIVVRPVPVETEEYTKSLIVCPNGNRFENVVFRGPPNLSKADQEAEFDLIGKQLAKITTLPSHRQEIQYV